MWTEQSFWCYQKVISEEISEGVTSRTLTGDCVVIVCVYLLQPCGFSSLYFSLHRSITWQRWIVLGRDDTSVCSLTSREAHVGLFSCHQLSAWPNVRFSSFKRVKPNHFGDEGFSKFLEWLPTKLFKILILAAICFVSALIFVILCCIAVLCKTASSFF